MHSTPVLAEEGEEGAGLTGEGGASLLVGGRGKWVNNLAMDTPPPEDHTHQSMPASSSAVSPVMTVPPGHAPFQRIHHEQGEDISDRISVTSKSVEIVGTMDMEPNQIQASLPYAALNTVPVRPHPSLATPDSQAVPRPSLATPDSQAVPRPPPVTTPTAVQSSANVPLGTVMARPHPQCPPRPHPQECPQGGCVFNSVESNSLLSQTSHTHTPSPAGQASFSHTCQSGQVRCSGGNEVLNNTFATSPQLGNSQDHSLSLQCSQSSVSSCNLQSKVYKVEESVHLDAKKLSLLIGDRTHVGVEYAELALVLPVKCNNRPTLKVKILPRHKFHSKSLAVMATLHIPGKCSWRKWLVQYSHSFIRINTSVFKERQNSPIRQTSIQEPILCTSELSCEDHLTHVVLDAVLAHEQVVYDKASHFTLVITAELEVKGFREDKTASHYQLVLLDQDCVKIDRIQETTGNQ